ncbi:DNA gyrase inhibitor YacG [Oceanicoccus sp. KOV_DT_Chl]|uniref:DNA gyrase inhibitor YacG n=1 Tax=Oceanicoccus sp. KOV_DT_Chl TaxID=1904639 RepID=UPI000C7DB872|nr:DNA gyrase inhibitor YacG [Oceanicoccus sp. KOV_DT_Chl]
MNTATKKIPCPSCKTAIEWRTDNPNRPFCSESCKNKDFIAWAEEDRAMAGNPIYDDFLSGDLEQE